MVAANDRKEGDLADGFIYRVTGLANGSAKAPAAAPGKKAPAKSGKRKPSKRRTPAKKKR